MSDHNIPTREALRVAFSGVALLLTAFYLAPANLYLFNGSEVSVSLAAVISATWPLQLGLAAIVAAVAVLGSSPVRRFFALTCLSLATLLYVQGNLLVWDYGLFDGTDINWQQHQLAGILEIGIWLTVVASTVLFRRRLWRHIYLVSLAVILLQAGGIGLPLLSGHSLTHRTTSTTDESLFEFSPNRNVLFILLDAFPAPTFDRLLANDPPLATELDGFTYFQDTVAVSPYTLLSIPTIFSGRVYDNSEAIGDFMAKSFSQGCLPRLMADNGYLPQVVTTGNYGQYLAGIPFRSADSFADSESPDTTIRDVLKIWDVTLFRYAPHFVKRIIHPDHSWLLQEKFLPTEVPELSAMSETAKTRLVTTAAQQSSDRLWSHLLTETTTTSPAPTFKFYHFFTSHPPYLMGVDGTPLTRVQYQDRILYERCQDQCEYTLHQVRQLLSRLRELGIFDQTMIVIMADHGSSAGHKGYSTPMNRGLPLLLIKPTHTHGPLQVSSAQASLLDIPATLTDALGLEADFPGIPLLAESPPPGRERPYFFFTWEKRFWQTDFLPLLSEYIVSGPSRERRSWHKGRQLTHGEAKIQD